MTLSRAAGLGVLAIGVGFLAGFMWGQAARRELPGATQTSFSGGVLTVKVDARQAVENGLLSAFG